MHNEDAVLESALKKPINFLKKELNFSYFLTDIQASDRSREKFSLSKKYLEVIIQSLEPKMFLDNVEV